MRCGFVGFATACAVMALSGVAHADTFDLRCEGKMSDGKTPKVVLLSINTDSPLVRVAQSTIDIHEPVNPEYLPMTQTPEMFVVRDSKLASLGITTTLVINRSTGILSKDDNGTSWRLDCVKGDYTGPVAKF